ncbi:hypothetical protein DUNSADRAFT_949 [Dunaliella salina]|uniref:AAA+ ATPase domain-containing protein n=2 Tax=Dunaliella salina TaxID=3046 RepID=A0ABQ7GXP1_DUNSA|nr:hypothetical protein DUNSADRAFT_949 [Dunaliella salina]|eukprot:KAF5839377.1 hypothetical protein DUNSADRAFT_949 [Dunaliella salina]
MLAQAHTYNPFGSDGRMGIPGTLHRISGMKNKDGEVHALTYRIGRHIPGVARIFADLLSPTDGSILLVGKPGVGKTTILRDITKILADTMHQAVIVVDTSNEIAGDTGSAHPCIGSARRFMVPYRSLQHEVLVEAVQNHTPDVLVVDKIGTVKDVEAAKTISHHGVRLIGTAHSHDIHSLMKNPELLPLLGGIESVALGDEEAKRSNKGRKVKLTRKGPPVFNILIEVLTDHRGHLGGDLLGAQRRLRMEEGESERSGTWQAILQIPISFVSCFSLG